MLMNTETEALLIVTANHAMCVLFVHGQCSAIIRHWLCLVNRGSVTYMHCTRFN